MDTNAVIRQDMLEKLPEPVRRYMNYTGVVGKPWINTVHLKQVGKFRMGIDKPWMPMTGEEIYTTNPPGFLWKAQFKMAGLPLMRGRDTYKNGHGHLFGRLAGLVTIFDQRGDELDQGAMMRYLNETAWFPIALLGDNMTWQAIDDQSAQVTLTDSGRSVSARLFFDEQGRQTNFSAMRYRSVDKGYSLDPWSTPMTAYGTLAGLNLPVHGKAVWNLPSGDLEYINLEIIEIAYNVPIESF